MLSWITGDLLREVSVICFTEARAAEPGSDFVERGQVEGSRVNFSSSQEIAFCDVEVCWFNVNIVIMVDHDIIVWLV